MKATFETMLATHDLTLPEELMSPLYKRTAHSIPRSIVAAYPQPPVLRGRQRRGTTEPQQREAKRSSSEIIAMAGRRSAARVTGTPRRAP